MIKRSSYPSLALKAAHRLAFGPTGTEAGPLAGPAKAALSLGFRQTVPWSHPDKPFFRTYAPAHAISIMGGTSGTMGLIFSMRREVLSKSMGWIDFQTVPPLVPLNSPGGTTWTNIIRGGYSGDLPRAENFPAQIGNHGKSVGLQSLNLSEKYASPHFPGCFPPRKAARTYRASTWGWGKQAPFTGMKLGSQRWRTRFAPHAASSNSAFSRCTTLTPTPISAAILRIPLPPANRAARMLSSLALPVRGRPSVLP